MAFLSCPKRKRKLNRRIANEQLPLIPITKFWTVPRHMKSPYVSIVTTTDSVVMIANKYVCNFEWYLDLGRVYRMF